MKEILYFLKIAIKGKDTGAISRSSHFVIQKVLKLISGRDLQQIVEYGAGDGVLTKELLKHLSPNGKILAVDTNPEFLKILRKIKDPRLVVMEDTLQNVSKNLKKYGFAKVDLIVSSIPFSYLSTKERDEVSKRTQKSLAQNGVFIIFHQYSIIMKKPLKKFFTQVETIFEPRNLFPCFIISAEK